MAITLQCPRCTHEQKIDDDKAGKDVPCKICHHLIKAPGGQEKPKSSLASMPKEEGIKAGTATLPTKKKPTTEKLSGKDNAPPKRPSPRSRSVDQGASPVLGLLLLGGGFLVLAVLCAGGGVGGYFLFRSSPKAEAKIAQNDKPGPQAQEENKPRENKPEPGPEPGPDPRPVQPPFIPPQPVALDANNPDDLDRVLDQLRGPPHLHGPAWAWLNQANPNHPRRNEVAKFLDEKIQQQLATSPFGNDTLYNPYFRWATRDSVPTLIRVVESQHGFEYPRYRAECMKLFAQFKDARSVEPVAKRLADRNERDRAAATLIAMGPMGQDVVLKYFNHPDASTRDSARQILDAYKTGNDALFTVCLTDLEGADDGKRGAALQWVGKAPVEDKRKPAISKALNKSLDHPDSFRNADLVAAVEKWGTVENVPKLAQMLDKSTFGNVPALRLLAKFRDPEGMKAVARSFANGFNRQEAQKVLKEYGPPAEPMIIEAMNNTQDGFARGAYISLLGELGTRNISGPALTQLAQRFPQDRILAIQVGQSLKAVNARGN